MLFCRINRVESGRVYAGGHVPRNYAITKADLANWRNADLQAMTRAPGAAGSIRSVRFDDDGERVTIRAEVLDAHEVEKLNAGLYSCIALDTDGKAHLLDYQPSTDAKLGKSHILAKSTLLAKIHQGDFDMDAEDLIGQIPASERAAAVQALGKIRAQHIDQQITEKAETMRKRAETTGKDIHEMDPGIFALIKMCRARGPSFVEDSRGLTELK
jgi:hypothetical protein